MAVLCTEHLFLTGRKGVGKSTLLRAVLEGKRLGGFFTRRITGIFERPSIHLLRAAEGQQPSPENLGCLCGERRAGPFGPVGAPAPGGAGGGGGGVPGGAGAPGGGGPGIPTGGAARAGRG